MSGSTNPHQSMSFFVTGLFFSPLLQTWEHRTWRHEPSEPHLRAWTSRRTTSYLLLLSAPSFPPSPLHSVAWTETRRCREKGARRTCSWEPVVSSEAFRKSQSGTGSPDRKKKKKRNAPRSPDETRARLKSQESDALSGPPPSLVTDRPFSQLQPDYNAMSSPIGSFFFSSVLRFVPHSWLTLLPDVDCQKVTGSQSEARTGDLRTWFHISAVRLGFS